MALPLRLSTERSLFDVPSFNQSIDTHIETPFELPIPFSELKIEISGVRLLYLRKQYKACASRCKQLLEDIELPVRFPFTRNIRSFLCSIPADQFDSQLHPIHRAALSFYAALCVELTAITHHPLSSNKLTLLAVASEYYGRALTALSAPSRPSSPSLTVSSAPSTPTTSPRSSLSPSTPPSSIASPSPSLSDTEEVREYLLRPNPLRVRKTVRFADPSSKTPPSTISAFTASATPATLLPRPMHSSSNSTSSNSSFNSRSSRSSSSSTCSSIMKKTQPMPPHTSSASSTEAYLLSRAQSQLDPNLVLVAIRTHAHRAATDDLMEQTRQCQRDRRVRFADLRDTSDPDMRAAERRSRIELLRARAWNRPRFDPAPYRELARVALAEL
ncbi:MAG: hypothetical protein M1825_002792 [Sarcosagium campestre]|nr:MAG: hypothetical protein M1825_002792 [Sarcosagium campestre]